MAKFGDMKGKTLVEIIGEVGDEVMRFTADDGMVFELYYEHD